MSLLAQIYSMSASGKGSLQDLRLNLRPAAKKRLNHTAKSASLLQGIRELNDFGFNSEAFSPVLPSGCTLLPAKHKTQTSVHVSDLWSHRQQRQFLQKTGLKEAQQERERQQRHEAYLALRNKQEDGHIMDALYERIVADNDPLEAARCYAAGRKGKLLKQLTNQILVNTQKFTHPLPSRLTDSRQDSALERTHSSMKKLEEIVHRCNDTLTRTKTSKLSLRQDYSALFSSKKLLLPEL